MSIKTLGISIAIGSVFAGAPAIGNAINSVNKLQSRVEELGNKRVRLKEEFGETSDEVKKLDKEVNKLTTSISKLKENELELKKLKEKRATFKSSIFDKVALGATAFAPIKLAIDFESAMADVGKVVDFGDGEAEIFGKSIRELSKTIPLTATELANITASGGQLGIAKEKLLEFTTITAKMSTAFDMLPSEAGDSIAKLMNIFGLSIDEASKLGDAINHISNNSAAKAKDMVNVLSRVGGISKMVGLGAKEVTTLSSAFLAMGSAPDVVGTSVNAILSKLATVDSQGDKFQKALGKIGLSSKELKANLKKNAQDGIVDFLEKIKKVNDDDKMTILTDMFGAEYSDDVALLVGGLDTYKKAISLVSKESKYLGSMQKEFEARSKTTANSMQLMQSNMKNIGITIGNLLLPPLNYLIGKISLFASWLGDIIEEYPTVSTIIGGLAIGIVGISIALSTLGFISSFASAGLLTLTSIITGLRLATVLTFGAIGLAIGVLAFGVMWVVDNFDTLKITFNEIGIGISVVFHIILDVISSVFKYIASSAISILKFGGVVVGFFAFVLAFISPVAFAIIALPVVFAGAFYLIIKHSEMLKNFFSELWVGIKTIFFIGVEFFKSIASMYVEAFVSVWSGIGDIFMQGWEVIKNIFSISPLEMIINAWTPAFEWISEKLNIFGGFFDFFAGENKVSANLSTQIQSPSEVLKANQTNTNNRQTNQTNHIQVVVNNPTSNVEVAKAISDGMQTQSKVSLWDEEY